jgi:hypothetical protein
MSSGSALTERQHLLRRRYGVALAVLGLLALALRLWNNAFGLPDAFEPDEPKIVNHALAFGLGDPNPHYFVYPAFQMYLLFAVYGVLYVGLRLAGTVASAEGFAVLFLGDPTLFYRTGRALTALFGAATAVGAGWLALRLHGSTRVGLLAAAAVAVHPVLVRQGHYVTTDVPVGFFVLVGTGACALLAVEPARRWSVAAGAALGLGFATKYSALILVVPLVTGAALAARRVGPARSLRRLALALLVAAVTAFAASPFTFLEWRATLDGMRFIYQVKSEGQFGVGGPGSWGDYLWLTLLAGPLAWLSLGGVAWAAWRRTAADLVLLAFAVPYFLAVASNRSHSERYLVPLLPVLLLLAARALVEVAAAGGRRRAAATAGVAAAVALVAAVGDSVAVVRDFGLEDTRAAARRWIEAEVPAGRIVAVEYGGESVRLREDPSTLAAKEERYRQGQARADHQDGEQMELALRLLRRVPGERPGYRLLELGRNDNNRLRFDDADLDELRRRGVAVMVTSDRTVAGSVRSEEARRVYPELMALRDRLQAEARLLRRFTPEPGRWRGPVIAVYGLAPSGEPAAPSNPEGGER